MWKLYLKLFRYVSGIVASTTCTWAVTLTISTTSAYPQEELTYIVSYHTFKRWSASWRCSCSGSLLLQTVLRAGDKGRHLRIRHDTVRRLFLERFRIAPPQLRAGRAAVLLLFSDLVRVVHRMPHACHNFDVIRIRGIDNLKITEYFEFRVY